VNRGGLPQRGPCLGLAQCVAGDELAERDRGEVQGGVVSSVCCGAYPAGFALDGGGDTGDGTCFVDCWRRRGRAGDRWWRDALGESIRKHDGRPVVQDGVGPGFRNGSGGEDVAADAAGVDFPAESALGVPELNTERVGSVGCRGAASGTGGRTRPRRRVRRPPIAAGPSPTALAVGRPSW